MRQFFAPTRVADVDADTSARRSLAQPRHLDELVAHHPPGGDDVRV